MCRNYICLRTSWSGPYYKHPDYHNHFTGLSLNKRYSLKHVSGHTSSSAHVSSHVTWLLTVTSVILADNFVLMKNLLDKSSTLEDSVFESVIEIISHFTKDLLRFERFSLPFFANLSVTGMVNLQLEWETFSSH